MIKHIVMWKVKEKALGKNKEENIENIKRQLEDLKSSIKEIVNLEVGTNIEELTGLHDLVLYTSFKNKEDLLTYQAHPRHIEVGKLIRELATDRACVDYEVGENSWVR